MSKKILLLKFSHETNSFCPTPADMTAFRNGALRVGEEVLTLSRGKGTDVGAVLKILEARADFELIPTVHLFANPSGPVTEEVFDFVADHVRDALQKNGPVDGVMINFHGAMVAQGHPDAEGDLLEQIRALVGEGIPVISTLDLHANVTAKMAKHATALISYEHYPHTDVHNTSLIGAQLMADTLDGKVKPVMAYRHIPHLLQIFPTARPEIRPLYELARECESRPGVLSVRFTHGFFAADMAEMGMSVIVVTDNDPAAAEEIAGELENAIRREKNKLQYDYPTLDEALDLISTPGDGPVVIADMSDNPGGGGLGNTTHILRRVLERGFTGGAMALIVDPVSVAACERAGVGTTVELELGGWGDQTYSGGPLSVSAYVRMLSDGRYQHKGTISNGAVVNCGKTAVVEIEGNLVIVTSLPFQPLDLEIFRRHGIAPEDQKFLITKSAVHYQASYGTVAREMIGVALPGLIPPTPESLNYQNWKNESEHQ